MRLLSIIIFRQVYNMKIKKKVISFAAKMVRTKIHKIRPIVPLRTAPIADIFYLGKKSIVLNAWIV